MYKNQGNCQASTMLFRVFRNARSLIHRYSAHPPTFDIWCASSIFLISSLLYNCEYVIYICASIECSHRYSSLPPTSATFRRFSSAPLQTLRLDDFGNWKNGGGLFHISADIHPSAIIEIGAIVHSLSIIAANVCIASGSIIGSSVHIGCSTSIGYNVALSNCSVGNSCVIHHGASIGQDGFGFFVSDEGFVTKKPQLLHVKIGSHVEIGANTCIDRGSWRETIIGDHSKIDNLVQIGHNVAIGCNCIICGQVGIAGSATLGDYVTMGGRAMVRDHVSIASKVRIAANSGVTRNIVESGDYGGFPAVPIREWRRQSAYIRKMYKDGSQKTNQTAHL